MKLRELHKARKAADIVAEREQRPLIVRKHVRAFQFGTLSDDQKIKILTEYPEVADRLGFPVAHVGLLINPVS